MKYFLMIPIILLVGCGERFTIIRTCDGPMFRRDKEFIVKRIEDGTLWYRSYNDGVIRIEDGTDLDSICK